MQHQKWSGAFIFIYVLDLRFFMFFFHIFLITILAHSDRPGSNKTYPNFNLMNFQIVKTNSKCDGSSWNNLLSSEMLCINLNWFEVGIKQEGIRFGVLRKKYQLKNRLRFSLRYRLIVLDFQSRCFGVSSLMRWRDQIASYEPPILTSALRMTWERN